MKEDIPFHLHRHYYDLQTYKGRVCHFFVMTNPRNAFVTNKQLNSAMYLLQRYRDGNASDATNPRLWRAREIVERCLIGGGRWVEMGEMVDISSF
jgi:hypothetical protein